MDFIFSVPDITFVPFGNDEVKIEWMDVQEYSKRGYNNFVKLTTASTHQNDTSLLKGNILSVDLTYLTQNDFGGKGTYSESYIWIYEKSEVQHAETEAATSVVHTFKVIK